MFYSSEVRPISPLRLNRLLFSVVPISLLFSFDTSYSTWLTACFFFFFCFSCLHCLHLSHVCTLLTCLCVRAASTSACVVVFVFLLFLYLCVCVFVCLCACVRPHVFLFVVFSPPPPVVPAGCIVSCALTPCPLTPACQKVWCTASIPRLAAVPEHQPLPIPGACPQSHGPTYLHPQLTSSEQRAPAGSAEQDADAPCQA